MNTAKLKAKFDKLISASPGGITYTFNGDVYTGTRTVLNREVAYSDYGLSAGYEFSIIETLDNLASVPASGELITVAGTDYRVMKTEQDSAGIAIRIDLGDKYPE